MPNRKHSLWWGTYIVALNLLCLWIEWKAGNSQVNEVSHTVYINIANNFSIMITFHLLSYPLSDLHPSPLLFMAATTPSMTLHGLSSIMGTAMMGQPCIIKSLWLIQLNIQLYLGQSHKELLFGIFCFYNVKDLVFEKEPSLFIIEETVMFSVFPLLALLLTAFHVLRVQFLQVPEKTGIVPMSIQTMISLAIFNGYVFWLPCLFPDSPPAVIGTSYWQLGPNSPPSPICPYHWPCVRFWPIDWKVDSQYWAISYMWALFSRLS